MNLAPPPAENYTQRDLSSDLYPQYPETGVMQVVESRGRGAGLLLQTAVNGTSSEVNVRLSCVMLRGVQDVSK